MKSMFCGARGCCSVTSAASNESLTYEYFDNVDLETGYNPVVQKVSTDMTTDITDELFDLSSDLYVFETDDEPEKFYWKEDNLCDEHLYSIRQRRQSHSMSNILDLNGDDPSITDRRCTYPPSRSNSRPPPWLQLISSPSNKKYEQRGVRHNQIGEPCGDQTNTLSLESVQLGMFCSTEGLIKEMSKGDINETEINNEKHVVPEKPKCPLCHP